MTLATDDAGGLRDREPTLCAPDGHVPLWHGVVEPPVSDYLAALGRARAKVFPLTWETRFRPTGDTLRGAVAGFAVWRGDAIEYV